MRRAFTIIDLLITISITGIVMTLTLPAMQAARWKGLEIKCLSNMRQTGVVLFAYAAANKDHIPFQGWEPRTIHIQGLPPIRMGHPTGNSIMTGRWSFLFPEEWSGQARWNPGLQCPKQPRYDPDSPFTTGALRWEHERPTPTYEFSFALYNRADTMGAGNTPADFRIGPNKISDATFPSAKVYLFEFPAFCMSDPVARSLALDIGRSTTPRTSIMTMDGAVRRFAAKDAIDYPERGETYSTVNGIWGRDIP